METIDIWIFPNTPNCDEVARLVGNDRRARLIDAKKFKDYLPPELTQVPGFVFKARDGKIYPWEGKKCLEYVRLHFSDPTKNLIGQLAGTPVQDIRDQPRTSYGPPQQRHRAQHSHYTPVGKNYPQAAPAQPSYNHRPQNHQMQPQPQERPPQAAYNQPRTQPINSFRSTGFANLMRNQVRGKTVVALDEGRMSVGGAPSGNNSDIMAERARQDAMYLQ